MKDIRTYPVYPSDLDVLASFKHAGAYFAECKYEEHLGYCEHTRFNVTVNDNRRIHANSFAEFIKTLEQYPRALPLYVHSHWHKRGVNDLMCGIDVMRSKIEITVESEDFNTLSAVHDKVREIFRASSPPPERSSHLSRYDLKKSVFVAYRFDDAGKAAANALMTFLRRLGFDIAEGAGYEARDIPEKVAERIRSQDILVCLVTPGDTSWVLSEAAFAKGLGKYVVIICQDNVAFKKAIVGSDYEHISFPEGNVEKAYCDLLYALPS